VADFGWIVVERWDEFQTYDTKRSERPPWIKNYTRLMDDEEYLELSPHCTAVLHRLWLVYAKSRCRLRADTSSLTRRLGLRVTKSHLESLNHAGFIRIVALNMSAEEAQDERTSALPEVEVEVEVEEPAGQSRSKTTGPAQQDEEIEQDEEPFARGPEPGLNGYSPVRREQWAGLEADDTMERL